MISGEEWQFEYTSSLYSKQYSNLRLVFDVFLFSNRARMMTCLGGNFPDSVGRAKHLKPPRPKLKGMMCHSHVAIGFLSITCRFYLPYQ